MSPPFSIIKSARTILIVCALAADAEHVQQTERFMSAKTSVVHDGLEQTIDHAVQSNMNQSIVYVGTYTVRGSRGIYACYFDHVTGQLSPLGLQAATINPSFLRVSPNQKYLYAVSEIGDYKGERCGAVFSYSINRDSGRLTQLNQVASHGAGPCYLSLNKTGQFVLVANFQDGSVAVFPVLENGELGKVSSFMKHHDIESNSKRESHAHAIKTSPDGQFAIAADLGLHQLLIYDFDCRNGLLTRSVPSHVRVRNGAGPRHFVFHPNGRFLYLIGELDSTVTVFSCNEMKGILQKQQAISTLPNDISGQNYAATLQIDVEGKYLYASNRGHDSITTLSIDPETGSLTFVDNVPSGGKTPRHFAIDPTGKYLLVANENSDNITVFSVDSKTGKLTKKHEIGEIPSPACLSFLSI